MRRETEPCTGARCRVAREVRERVLELDPHVARVLDAPLAFLLQAAFHDMHDAARRIGRQQRSNPAPRSNTATTVSAGVGHVERALAGEQLVDPVAPNDQMSERRSTSISPRACSGLMYGAVPMIDPPSVVTV